ncbi:MAG: hypothetical protein HYS22_04320 [Deltaproteobacteria bacterium]|nr:hypothetical protein [Deltaproteobacteria bacterium]
MNCHSLIISAVIVTFLLPTLSVFGGEKKKTTKSLITPSATDTFGTAGVRGFTLDEKKPAKKKTWKNKKAKD